MWTKSRVASNPHLRRALEPTPILPPALEGDIEVQELMLTSAARWKALQATYSVTSYPAEGSDAQPEVKSHQVWTGSRVNSR